MASASYLEALLAHVERVGAQFGESPRHQAAQEALPPELSRSGLPPASLHAWMGATRSQLLD